MMSCGASLAPSISHVDAAQDFVREIAPVQDSRVDLISISGHKTYAPKGIGTLIVRRRGYEKLPLAPLLFGGGQERGLRPGTVPVPLVVGLGLAAPSCAHGAREPRGKSQGVSENGIERTRAARAGVQRRSRPGVATHRESRHSKT